MIGVIVAVAVVATVAASIFLSRFVRHPEQTTMQPDEVGRETTSDRLYGGSNRPAGPDADSPVSPTGQSEPGSGIRADPGPDPSA